MHQDSTPSSPVPDLAAAPKYACPACGGQAQWNPSHQKLICISCGTESPYKLNPAQGRMEEMDLASVVAHPADARQGTKTVKCLTCNALTVFEAARVGQLCAFCGSPELISYDEIGASIQPHGVLPFNIPQSDVRDRMRQWFARAPLAPRFLKRRARVDEVKGIYVPYWTFDARVRCPWTARARIESLKGVEWQPVEGIVDHVFDDMLMPAAGGIRTELLKAVEPWPVEQLVPYDRAYLSGFIVEHYQAGPSDAAKVVRKEMAKIIANLCKLAVEEQEDRYHLLHIAPEYSSETFKLVLMPVWLLSCSYRGTTFQVVANGRTGAIKGDSPTSWWKVLFMAVFWLAVLAAILMTVFGLPGLLLYRGGR